MSGRSRKRKKPEESEPQVSGLKKMVTLPRLLIGTVAGMLLGLGAYLLSDHDQPRQNDITTDQLDRDFEEIGLGALGVPEHARLPEPVEDNAPQAVSFEPQSNSADFQFAHAETPASDNPSNEPTVVYPEASATAGPLFPNPLSVPSAQPIQPTQYSGPAPGTQAASGPAWLTGGIEFEE